MPFTPAHAIVAIPLRRSGLVASAVAVGAMTPDLPRFLPLTLPPGDDWAHSPAWLAASTALAGLVWLFWRRLLAPIARDLSPHWMAERYTGPPPGSLARPRPVRIALVALSLALGVLSHVLWDSFTHANDWGASLIGLDGEVGGLSAWTWAQDASSVLGLAILAWWFLRQPRSVLDGAARLRARTARLVVAGAMLAAVAVAVVVGLIGGNTAHGMAWVGARAGGTAVGTVLLLAPAAWWLLVPRVAPGSAPVSRG